MMARTAQRVLAFLARFCVGVHHFGLAGALRVFVLARWRSDDALTSVQLRMLGRPFWYRACSDRGVLCQFYTEGFRVVDQFGPHRVAVIVDAGANIGDSTMRFRRFHPGAKILAIEADAGNFAVLQKNFAGDARTIALHRALWNREGELKVWPTWAHVASRVGESPDHAAAVPVPGCTVPGLMQEFELSDIDILKLDIEGAESVVFQTSDTSWLARVRCIVFECCDADDAGTTMKVFDALRQAGWRGNCHVCGENLIVIRNDLPWHMSPDLWMESEPRVAAHIKEAMSDAALSAN